MAKKPNEPQSEKLEQTTTPVRRTPSVRESRPAMTEPVSKEIPVKKTSKKAEPKVPGTGGAGNGEMREVTDQMIAERAYFIGQTRGGSMDDNWHQAERELRGGA